MTSSVVLRSNVAQQPTELQSKLERSLHLAVQWVQDHDYRGYEPADGNLSGLFPLTGGRVLPMRVLQQVVLRAPFNIRPLVGVRPHESAIGRGYMAWGYLAMYRLKPSQALRDRAVSCFEWLIRNRAPRYDDFCWGDPYEYATRGGRRPLGEPTLIWSALIGQAFLDGFEVLGEQTYLKVAESIGNWILKLPVETTESGLCLSYVKYRQSSIHNANAMGAAFLARLGAVTGDVGALSTARRAMLYACVRQRSDGSWLYGEEAKYHWIDNFHTGYNLSALRTYATATKDRSFDGHYAKGLQFFKGNFVDDVGRSKYFHDRTYPVDIQCAAQTIETLGEAAERDLECLTLAEKVARWTIDNLQGDDGHFYYRDLGWTKVTTPMLHWGQGTMIKALAVTLERLHGC